MGVLTIAVGSVLIALLACLLGCSMLSTISRTRSLHQSVPGLLARLQVATRKVVAVSLACALAFTLRCVCWFWEPVTREYFPHWGYPHLFYTIDVVPTTVLFFALLPGPTSFRASLLARVASGPDRSSAVAIERTGDQLELRDKDEKRSDAI